MSEHFPDDEALSADLDGEGDAATAEHLASCATCETRLGELRAAAEAVGAPVGRRPDVERAAAVGAALAAIDGKTPSARRRVPPWLAAAAAALVLVLAVPIVLSQRESNDETAQRTASGSFEDASPGVIATPPEDIGAQSDPQALARLLDEQMRAPRPLPGAALSAEAARDAREGEAAPGGVTGGRVGSADGELGAPCQTEAREAGANRVGTLLYTALLEWQTTPAVVHVFQAPDPNAQTLTRRAFVMARSDCQLLVAPSF